MFVDIQILLHRLEKAKHTYVRTRTHSRGENLKLIDTREETFKNYFRKRGGQQESVAGERQSAGVPIESSIGARSSLAAKSAKSKHTDKKYNGIREGRGGSSPFE